MSPALSKYRGLAGVGLWLALVPAKWPQQPQPQPQSQAPQSQAPARPRRPAVAAAEIPQPPQVLFKDLFIAVEMARLFADSKTFADATPKFPPPEILARYRDANPASPEALKSFVATNFSVPEAVAAPAELKPSGEPVTITQ